MRNITIQQVVQALRYVDAANPTPSEVGRRTRFLAAFPDQEANVLSYQDNPNCKCRADLSSAIQKAPGDKDVLLTGVMGEEVHLIVPVNLMGKVLVIDDTEEAWAALAKRFMAESMMFRGMAIVPATIDGVAKLRIFFH
jgi:hypothetical protein